MEERKLEVLRAIVEDYVSTQEPVGSKALAERHHIGVSPATIRNDMAVLEDEGYITQPHTSAGRVPTDKGYRLFVDRLVAVKPLSPAERRAIGTFLNGAADLDQLVDRSVRLLSQLTRQVAVVQYPSLTRSTVRHVELVPIGGTRVLLVVITDTGRVDQRVVALSEAVDEATLSDMRARINAAVAGTSLPDALRVLPDVPQGVGGRTRPIMTSLVATILEALGDSYEERVTVAGTANLIRYGQDFDEGIRPLLEALEEHVVLLRLMGEVTSPTSLRVSIGEENAEDGLSSSSIVSVGYGPGELAVGSMGVVGPTHMDYPGTIAAVRAVARYVSQILAGH